LDIGFPFMRGWVSNRQSPPYAVGWQAGIPRL